VSPGSPVAITGAGAVSPLGVGAAALHERWAAGDCAIEDGIARCRDFDPTDVLSRKDARRMHRFVQLGVAAAEEAIQTAWGGELPYPPERIACMLGVAFGGTELVCDQFVLHEREGADAVWTLTVPVAMANAAAAALAIRHGFRGETHSIGSACAASSQAIGEGTRLIRLGVADAVVVGGTESCVNPFMQAAFRSAGALSRLGLSRPFDHRRDGFVLGEGAGVLVLEDADRARERGAEVLGYVAGFASTTDGEHLTAPHPTGELCALAISTALQDAGIAPQEVDWVNAHGTSTLSNDRAETMALKTALGPRAYEVPISAPKSAIGHSIGAAGGVEAVATLMALRAGVAPPTVGLEQPEEGLDLNYVPGGSVPLTPQNGNGRLVAISNSFAFGGHNATLVITT
jgi:3-oxoacyl-[acyl-carrier-protein] synthase II